MAQQDEKIKDEKEAKKKSPEDEARERAQEEAQTRQDADEERAREKLAGALVEEGGGEEDEEKEYVERKRWLELVDQLRGIKAIEGIRKLKEKGEGKLSDEDKDRLEDFKLDLKRRLFKLMERAGKADEERWKLTVLGSGEGLVRDYKVDIFGLDEWLLKEWIDKIGNLEDFFEYDCKDVPSIEVGPEGNYNASELKRLGTSWLFKEVEAGDHSYDDDVKKYFIIDNEGARELLQDGAEERNRRIEALEDENKRIKELLNEIK